MAGDSKVSVAMIVAMAANRVIGRNNQLPWHLPNDLKYFKTTTMGKPVIMGRKTYESIGKPLPGRTNIIISGNPAYVAEGVTVVHDVDTALELAEAIATGQGISEVMVIGGAQIYAKMLPRADRLYLTLVHAEVEGDALFPGLDFDLWQQSARQDFKAEGANPFDYSFVVYERSA